MKKQNGGFVLNGKDFELIFPISLPILYPQTVPTLKYPTLIVNNPIDILPDTLQHCYNNSRKTLHGIKVTETERGRTPSRGFGKNVYSDLGIMVVSLFWLEGGRCFGVGEMLLLRGLLFKLFH